MSEDAFHIGDAICPLCQEPIKLSHHDNLGDGESMVCMKPKAVPSSGQSEPTAIDDLRAHAAIDAAGFRVAVDLLGMATLWCKECGRDSGFHHDGCSKAQRTADGSSAAGNEQKGKAT